MVWVESNLYPTTCYVPGDRQHTKWHAPSAWNSKGCVSTCFGYSDFSKLPEKKATQMQQQHIAFKPYLFLFFLTVKTTHLRKQDCYLSGLIVEYDLLTIGDHVAIGSGSLGWVNYLGRIVSALKHGCCLKVVGCFKMPFEAYRCGNLQMCYWCYWMQWLIGILAHRTSDDEQGVCNHLRNAGYSGSFESL